MAFFRKNTCTISINTRQKEEFAVNDNYHLTSRQPSLLFKACDHPLINRNNRYSIYEQLISNTTLREGVNND